MKNEFGNVYLSRGNRQPVDYQSFYATSESLQNRQLHPDLSETVRLHEELSHGKDQVVARIIDRL